VRPRLRIDNRLVDLRQATSAIWATRRTFVGFCADASLLV
jgi:hypothetical protein